MIMIIVVMVMMMIMIYISCCEAFLELLGGILVRCYMELNMQMLPVSQQRGRSSG
jgi:hypothetical protein